MKLRGAAMALVLAAALRAHADGFTLVTGTTQSVSMFGVTAAWAVDPTVAEAVAEQGNVTLFGRAAGRTTIVVVGVTGEHRYDVVVTPRTNATAQTKAGADRANAEVRYSSAAHEIQTAAAVTRVDKERRVEASVRAIQRAGDTADDRARTSIAGAAYSVFAGKRELTLFDRDVDHSPLTLDATPLRGIHYLDDRWRLHAGYTAYTTYRSFLIPVERQLVAGGGYVFRTGARSSLMPSLFAIRGKNAVASLLYDYSDPEHLLVRTELGFSHGLGGAADVAYDGAADRLRAAVRYRPDAFAVPGTATPRGFFGDAAWTHDYRRDSSISLTASATDVLGIRMLGGTADVDRRLNSVVALDGGASWATFDGRRTLTIPAGVRLDFARGGITALYRYSRAYDNEGGQGFRIAGRLSLGRAFLSAFADRQRNAPTLELIFSERPDLALALEELGITATSPADVARALREQATLRELGFIDGVTIHLAPVRTQLGFEAAWLGTSESRQQLRARLLRSVTESVAARTTTLIATLSYSRRLYAATDVFGSWSYWRIDAGKGAARAQPFVELGLHQRFDGLPSVFGDRGTISGVVFRDDDLDGVSDGAGVPAEVELDGTRRERTGDDGTFRFTGVSRGTHRVVARVPERPDAYFTTPSRVEAEPGDRISFGVATTPARLFGRVRDDAGAGVGGVRLLLSRGAQQLAASSNSDGQFNFAAAPGAWRLSLVPDSIPAGYSVVENDERETLLDRGQPAKVELVLRAHRLLRGRAAPLSEIEVQPLARRVRTDAEGRFTLRSLAPGTLTLTSGGVARRVEIPKGPATIDVDLVPAVAVASQAVRTEVHGERAARMDAHVVQIGAFRIHANAVAAAERARSAGVPVVLETSGTLTLVRTAPLQTRQEAASIAGRLARAGVEAVILRR